MNPSQYSPTAPAPTAPATSLPTGDRIGDQMVRAPRSRAEAHRGSTAAQVGAIQPLTADQIATGARLMMDNMSRVIAGKPEAIRLAVTMFLAHGHVLIEDVPGVGKTMLARALAASIGASAKRIQFTPDLLPSDVTGAPIFNQQTRQFEFEPGPIFANVVIADEINRASPRTQSALLECMEEGQVTVEGTTYPLATPFHVVATQNPIDMEGTHPLAEAQRDRFMARISMGYPGPDHELEMVKARDLAEPITSLKPVVSLMDAARLIESARRTYVADAVADYAVALTRATRQSGALTLGASPRAGIHLVRAAKAWAALHGRQYVLPDDIQALAEPVLAHRVVLASPARGPAAMTQAAQAIKACLASVPVPVPIAG